jgi:hypothetical protein
MHPGQATPRCQRFTSAVSKQLHITEVTSLAEVTELNGRSDCTPIISDVRAISVPAFANESGELREKLINVTIGNVP